MTSQTENPVVEQVKEAISDVVSQEMDNKNLKIRAIGRMTGVKHPQIIRIKTKENYTVDTVLKVLHGLGKTIRITEK